MDNRIHFYHIFKCGLGGWNILRLVGGGFVGSTSLIQTLDVTVYEVLHRPNFDLGRRILFHTFKA